MVTFIAVALLLLIGVVVAALRLAALFALLFGCLGASTLSLAAAEAVGAEVSAARREVLATATSTLRLVQHRGRPGFRGPRDERWRMRTPASGLVESSALLLYKALVAITL